MARDSLDSLEENAFLLIAGDTTIHSTWFLQGIEDYRSDVLPFSPGHLRGWYVDQLQTRYPDDPWPTFNATTSQRNYTRAVLDAQVGHRPIYLTASVNPEEYFQPGQDFVLGPRGLVQQLLPRGSRPVTAQSLQQSARLLLESVGELTPVQADVDMDFKSIYIEYALALVRIGEALQRTQQLDLARELLTKVALLRPDHFERQVYREVYRTLGRRIPILNLEQSAARKLQEMAGR
jgi:hypothetical protein